MMRNRLTVIGVVVVALLILAFMSLYVVDQRQQAIVLRLGEPVRVVNAPGRDAPGLKLKIPLVETVVKFDKRNISFDTSEEEINAADQQRLVVDAYVRYRISDPLQFYRAMRTEQTAAVRLESLVNSAMREQLGAATREQIISEQRPILMQRIRDNIIRRARDSGFGVEILDFRIRRADLPQANQNAVYERMKTARRQEAAQIRATGRQESQEIVATATKQAQETRGQGDAERARVFAESFGRDPSFASFYRSMQAYEASMGQGDTTLVLSPDSEFFRYFSGGPSR